jgi:hypothetical protein
MATQRDVPDWMTLSGGRRQSGTRSARANPAPASRPAERGQQAPAPAAANALNSHFRKGPVDWREFARGALLLGVVGLTLWVEWRVIASLATFVTHLTAGSPH